MKDFMLLCAIVVLGLVAFILLIGEMPNATLGQFVTEKIVALALCYSWYRLIKYVFKF